MFNTTDIETNCEFYNHLENNFFISQSEHEAVTFIYANIRSMRKNFNQFLAELKTHISVDLSFIILSEVWINSDEVVLYKIPGYNVVYKCNDSYRAGGVICFINETIDYLQLD